MRSFRKKWENIRKSRPKVTPGQDLSHGTIIFYLMTLTLKFDLQMYFWKTLTLAITFKQEVISLSYCTLVFLVTRPFTWYHNSWPCDIDLEVWPTFEKLYITLVITFKPEVIGLSYCTCVFFVTRPFTWYHNFWPRDLDLEVWPCFEKL